MRCSALWLAVVALVASSPARAEPTAEDRALATALFRDGRALLEAGDVAHACPKLEESQRLDPGGGTLLNLALCHERANRLASAWAEYVEALGIARREGRADRAGVADERARELEQRLSRLTIVVPPGTPREGLEVRRDATLVGSAAWGTPMPVDGGEHGVEVRAPGMRPWRASVALAAEGQQSTIVVGPLVAEAGPMPAAAFASAPPVSPVAPVAAPDEARGTTQDATPTARTLGWAAVGAGGLAIGVGAYFGVRAFTKVRASDDAGAGGCTQACADLMDDARASADASTVAFALGAALGATGAYLLLTTPAPASRPGAGASVGARRAPGGALVTLDAAF